MFQLPKGQTTDVERKMLHHLRVWIAALAVACVAVGVGIGAILAGHTAVAQNDTQQIARAPEALSASFVEIARRVEPAVVNIHTVSAVPEVTQNGEEEDDEAGPSNNPLLEMFRQRSRRPSRGVGSGFIIDPKGIILTNQHVVEGAATINVILKTGEMLRGSVVGMDDETDLAVIKVNTPRDLPTVKLGDSNTAEVGDWVLAIGSPFDLENTVTAGIISTKERRTPYSGSFQRFLQTDAAINRGNSGGPLVNMRGEVIGVNSQIATSTGDYNGIGFALPSNEASFVYRQLSLPGSKVRRGYLGIILEPMKSEFARVYGLPEAKGAIVTDVREQQGPAAKAGIQANDIIVEFNGQSIIDSQDLINKVAATQVGQTAQLAFLREINGKLERRTTSVTIGERPPRASTVPTVERGPRSKDSKSKESTEGYRPRLGLTLTELTPQLAAAENLRAVRGLLVKDVDPSGLAAEARVSEGWVVQRINRIPVTTLKEFENVVKDLKAGDAIVLHAVRNEDGRLIQRIFQFTYQ